MTLARMIRLHKVPDRPRLLDQGLREMVDEDVKQVGELFARYMDRFHMSPIYNDDEILHQFLSGRGNGPRGPDSWKTRREGQVVWTYVVEVRIPSASFSRLLLTPPPYPRPEPEYTQNHRLLLVLLVAFDDYPP